MQNQIKVDTKISTNGMIEQTVSTEREKIVEEIMNTKEEHVKKSSYSYGMDTTSK